MHTIPSRIWYKCKDLFENQISCFNFTCSQCWTCQRNRMPDARNGIYETGFTKRTCNFVLPIRKMRKGKIAKYVIKVKLSLCFTKYQALKTYLVSGGIAPRIFHLSTRWRWVVSFLPRPLYPRGKSPRCRLCRRLGGPQSRSGHSGGKKTMPLPGIEPRSLHWLSYPHSVKCLT